MDVIYQMYHHGHEIKISDIGFKPWSLVCDPFFQAFKIYFLGQNE